MKLILLAILLIFIAIIFNYIGAGNYETIANDKLIFFLELNPNNQSQYVKVAKSNRKYVFIEVIDSLTQTWFYKIKIIDLNQYSQKLIQKNISFWEKSKK